MPLVISGFKGWNSDDLHKRFMKGEREGWLRYLGFTPYADLPALYAGATTFIFPSIYEGFGLPVLEAMASGTPVVCSNSSSLPEVVGDVALMCDALDVETLTTLIIKSLEDDPGDCGQGNMEYNVPVNFLGKGVLAKQSLHINR